jgi:hypothetical protein
LLEALGLSDVERPLADWVFFSDFFAGFFEVLLAAEGFFAAFPLFAGVLFLARFFDGAALAAARRNLRTFLPLRFLAVFLLAIATTIPLVLNSILLGADRRRGA